ncbi:MAG: ABC transporter ATP-binding protein [Burkholderiaceae bacterium]
MALLEIRGLKTHFKTDAGWLHAVDGVDLSVNAGETVCVVGESGSGKSVTAMSILKLVPMPPGRIVAGQVLWDGRDLVPLSQGEMQKLRGREIGVVFQEPMTALNPVYTVGEQISEGLRLHEGLSRAAAMDRAAELLALVHIPMAARRVLDYPHQFSGGMRQRVMIAMALACKPRLLIADEPTTALDVTIQAQILDLLTELKERLGMAVLLITHAMGVVAEVAQRVVVMYAGQVIEEGSVEEVFERPWHPYTQGLIRSIPRIDADASRGSRLVSIPGTVPSLVEPPPGCRFAPRCAYARDACTQATPTLRQVGPGHSVACILEEAPR